MVGVQGDQWPQLSGITSSLVTIVYVRIYILDVGSVLA